MSIRTNEAYHTPVLLEEVIQYLRITPGCRYIDATVGGGGHAEAVIRHGGEVLGFDQDPAAVTYARRKLTQELPAGYAGSWLVVRSNFKNIAVVAQEFGWAPVAGVLFDLGVSSHQFDASKRGFTFRRNQLLDMRMNPEDRQTATDVLNSYSEEQLYAVFTRFGEEQLAQQLAHHITSTRRLTPITTTQQLLHIVLAVKKQSGTIHPATTVFQALRIEVNEELQNLYEGLEAGVQVLKPKGRMVVISFHSLEDRIVKLFFQRQKSLEVLTKKPIMAQEWEVSQNRRARSAKLRAAERIIL